MEGDNSVSARSKALNEANSRQRVEVPRREFAPTAVQQPIEGGPIRRWLSKRNKIDNVVQCNAVARASRECMYQFGCPNSLTHFTGRDRFYDYVACNRKTYRGLCVKFSTFLYDFNQSLLLSTYLRKVPSIKFHGNPCSGSRADTCGKMDGHEANSNTVRKQFPSALLFRTLCEHEKVLYSPYWALGYS